MSEWLVGLLVGALLGWSPAPEPLRGIDASHHKGAIDFERVAGSGIDFAYLKASEGTGFVDPRFAAHRWEALAAGLRVGGYHYFQLCSDGEAQGRHFVRVLGKLTRRELPPAVDLELAGSCGDPPAREVLLAEVREFLAVVEATTGRQVTVYLYPEFEDRYAFARVIDRPLWLRRLGDRAPEGDWKVWQKSQTARVPGVEGGVDLNLMKEPD